jgi:HD superfamily phosphohydrolase
MFKRTSNSVNRVMKLANQESELRGAPWLSTGDILVGLLREQGIARHVLTSADVSLEPLRRELANLGCHESETKDEPPSKAAIIAAMTEAHRLGHSEADTEHLLFGLLTVPECVAVQALRLLSVDIDKLKLELQSILQRTESFSHSTPEAASSGKVVFIPVNPAPLADRNSGWWQIPELEELETGRAIIRIPAEQNIPLTSRVRAIIDTPQFQRLSEISQLGLVAKVYPGARHTRFEHSLGVYHNCLLYLRQLRESARFRELVSPRRGEALIVAALLHDLGHWPFCHPIEDLRIDGVPHHEAFAERFLSEGSELDCVLKSDWGLSYKDVTQLLMGASTHSAGKLLQSILSGPIDIDKLDYLERDSLHSGVPYGRHFDKQRLIQSLVLNEAGDGLAITSKGKTAAELMVHSRYVMFSEVYWHHAVRSATSMFARAFYELREHVDLSLMFTDSDAGMIAQLRMAAAGHPSEGLLESVFGRRRALYKRAAEFSHLSDEEVYRRLSRRPYAELVDVSRRLASRVGAAVGREVPAMQVLVDGPPPHREVEFAVDVYFPKERVYRPLRGVSPMIDALARTSFDDYVKRVRVFIEPELARSLQESGVDDAWWRETVLASA